MMGFVRTARYWAWCAGIVLPVALAAGAAQAKPLSEADARTLLTRTGFAPTQTEVARFVGREHAQAVEQLLAEASAPPRTPAPEWLKEPPTRPPGRDATPDERQAYQRSQAQHVMELRNTWVREMLTTPAPLAERMTLFWHNHFVVSAQKVRNAYAIARQNALLRQHAVGNFATLLHAAATDPAMLVYLDSATNRKGQPNENFAREVMELFTLGEGNYTERDIKEAARAFTGWTVDRETLQFEFRRAWHDDGPKTVLGVTGAHDGKAVLDILLRQPAAGEFIVGKLWKEFISPAPDRAEVARIAQAFRNSGYDIKVALRGLLNLPQLLSSANKGALVKSPVELVVGTVRQLGVRYTDPLPFTLSISGQGQVLLAPPNVRGWPGGEAWINSTTLLNRKQFLERLFRVDEMREFAGQVPQGMAMETMADMRPRDAAGGQQAIRGLNEEGRAQFRRAAASIQFDSGKFLDQFVGQPYSAVKRALLPVDAANPISNELAQAALLRAIVLDPAYQVK